MIELSYETPSYVNDVYFTENGEKRGQILQGEWLNFEESLSSIGRVIRALDGTEHVQGIPNHRAEVRLEIVGMPHELRERIIEASRSNNTSIGVGRRYPILKEYDPAELNVVWVFGNIEEMNVTQNMHGTVISFIGHLEDVSYPDGDS